MVPLTREDCLVAAWAAEHWPVHWDGEFNQANGVWRPEKAVVRWRKAYHRTAELVEWSVRWHYYKSTGKPLCIDLWFRPLEVAMNFRKMAGALAVEFDDDQREKIEMLHDALLAVQFGNYIVNSLETK